MKKIFTTTLLSLSVFAATAQFVVTPEVKTISGAKDYYEIVGYTHIINNSTDSVFSWKRVQNNIPVTWNSAICDRVTCWSFETSKNTFVIPPGDSSNLDVHIYPGNTTGSGMVELLVWMNDDSVNAKTVTVNASTWPASVKKAPAARDLQVYPNPASTSLTLKFEAQKPIAIEIYDILGKKVLSAQHNALESKIDVSALQNGIYIIRVQEDGKVYTKTFKKAD